MDKGYILFVVINSGRRFKKVKKKLIEMGYNRFTVISTYGTTNVLETVDFGGILAGSLGGQEEHQGSKTLYLVVQTEDEVKEIMDALEEVQNMDVMKPGKGIMFTIPLYSSYGVRFESSRIYKNSKSSK